MDEKLIARKNELKKLMLPLEWDKKLKQLHFAREMELKAYRTELETIEKEMTGEKSSENL